MQTLRSTKTLCRFALTACLVVLLGLSQADAALIAEWNFTVDENANFVNGPSATGTLVGSATVNTGSTGVSEDFIDITRNGALNIPDSSGNNLTTASTFSAFFKDVSAGGGGFNPGVGTAVILWSPENATSSAREYLFNHANDTNRQAVSIRRLSDSTIGLHIGRGTENILTASTGAITWDPSKYYLVAGSWDSNSTGFTTDSGGRVSIYVRELELGSVALSSLATGNIVGTLGAGTDVSLTIGMRADVSTEYAEGDYALLRFYDEYFDETRFSLEFGSLKVAPEPSSSTLMGFGLFGLLSRRRKRMGRQWKFRG
jgi:hypothetical protein